MAREGDDANAVGAVARVVVAFCAGASVAVGVMSTLEARRRRTEEANDARERETTATREETMGSMVTSMVTSTSTRETRTSYDLTDEILREQFTRMCSFSARRDKRRCETRSSSSSGSVASVRTRRA